MPIKAVVFDLGGVVFESPLSFLVDFERAHGLPQNLIARLVGGYAATDGAWQRLERGEILLSEFCERFDEHLRSAGVTLSSERMMLEMAEKGSVRANMLAAIRKLRQSGLSVAALTNNWVVGADYDERLQPLRDEFHAFIESCKVGMRKPEPGIYALTLEQIGVAATETVFLDDIGGNLKVARQLGMHTIKVVEPESALAELGNLVGLSLG